MPQDNSIPNKIWQMPSAVDGYIEGRQAKAQNDIASRNAMIQDRQMKALDRGDSEEALKQLAPAIVALQDGDVAGFEQLKQFGGKLGIDPGILGKHSINELPQLKQVASQYITATKDQSTGDIKEYNFAKSQGFGGTFSDWITQNKRAGATSVTVNNAGERAFEKKTGEAQADMFAELTKDGIAARADMASIGELDDSLAKVPGGLLGGLQQVALSWGIPLGKGATEAQAANAIIARLVPAQRPPGSGPMSDRDVLLFKDSLPKLINTREGNALILQTMKAMAKYRLQQANIASEAMSGKITRAEATQLLNGMEDPLAAFKAFRKGGGKDMPGKPIGGGVARPKTRKEYDALPSGTKFIAPDGSPRTKP